MPSQSQIHFETWKVETGGMGQKSIHAFVKARAYQGRAQHVEGAEAALAHEPLLDALLQGLHPTQPRRLFRQRLLQLFGSWDGLGWDRQSVRILLAGA